MKKVVIIGGGAAGFFTAINAKEFNPELDITILEKGKDVLQKVKISGGGRCNVTHACFDPKELTSNYPRGERELLGPFHQFMTGDTFEWFENNGIPLKIEEDGRVFPESNSSQTIIDCFLDKTKQLGIPVVTHAGVVSIIRDGNQWQLSTKSINYRCDALVVASGSSKQIWKLLSELGHKIVNPVPSLFTFNINDARLTNLAGISVSDVELSMMGSDFETRGPILITHWGLSGPAVLKLSAFGARKLNELNYEYEVRVNWVSASYQEVYENLISFKSSRGNQRVSLKCPFEKIPKRLWEHLIAEADILPSQNWADLSKTQIDATVKQLIQCSFRAKGKSTFKEEFVTAGGVELKEIDFKHFKSKLHENMYLIGEVINVDAVTGGFNFQNAWTGGWIAAKSLAKL